jgi:hypothetical protein
MLWLQSAISTAASELGANIRPAIVYRSATKWGSEPSHCKPNENDRGLWTLLYGTDRLQFINLEIAGQQIVST